MDGVLAGPGYTGAPFVLFGPSHLAALAVTVLLLVAMVRGFRGSSGKVKTCARWTLALLLWGQEISFHAWRVITGTWSVQEMLPLHLCALGVWLGGLMLVTGSRALFSVLYFTSLAGAAVAL
ncbi:MAG TPA: TIGR02206 family membrane protein, partial [Propionibacteriaceae bacterium]|nr:TIGR02206 family membrane protein [Propionibacteriaceae bacterium]HBY21797.1 TIGR02206 family membrane protein [Propionibacteriaceae bacterium]